MDKIDVFVRLGSLKTPIMWNRVNGIMVGVAVTQG